jgi:predicted chitinase
VGVVGNFTSSECCAITVDFLERVLGKSGDWFTGKGGSAQFLLHFPEKYPNIYKFDKYNFVSLLNDRMRAYGVVECYQKAHFIAQCFYESAGFETTIEFSSGQGYDPGVHKNAIKNGNTSPGDGPKYKGRGLIQLTWKNTYKAYSKYRGMDFVSNPDLIASDMENSIDASCWFWRNKGGIEKKYGANGDINVLIEHEKSNVALVTLSVNGGSNGLGERQALFDKIKKEWGLM